MEWISVEDKLPENRKYVLFWDGKDVYFGSRHYTSDGFKWFGHNDESINEVFISHWMPLPKPPEE